MAQNLVIGKPMPNAPMLSMSISSSPILSKAMPNKPRGFTYMGLLMLMAIAGIAMAGVGVVWHQDMQREREKELLFIGEQYRQAIGRYYENPLNGTKQYPENLADLLLDKRTPSAKRHLRQLYADPMQFSQKTGEQITEQTAEDQNAASGATWGLVKQQNQIVGVYSESTQAPIKKFGFAPLYAGFAEAQTYADWKFVYAPDAVAAESPPTVDIQAADIPAADTAAADTQNPSF